MKKIATGIIATLLLLSLIGCQSNNIDTQQADNDRIIACPEDAKICSDGTIVGREGLACEFPACPGEEAVVPE
ncbi:hypothetical protein COV81_03450 [Candidatus Peregrinibacteria bacterium CG11_big_fil_rev_8_21_14_0_20_41_10]|nr:MAG: hypothetical protein COV81_03450 [Candidatus Peregrinibacteria bacterium CG11_big_fil_rev_8_21_14_0_20_41_10]PIZ73046.1 MAG: hypothetical protein COY06_05900 [Candidatus Peregrinibacteria bacterium CG_4_10_14_0_2_um_filter_41_8]PJC38081.1 MAG: hypothetical protein CO045_02180 [Candidatus Peregrinibacteria bacterium CG_4_9_14_0_2_um_filter_41_14]